MMSILMLAACQVVTSAMENNKVRKGRGGSTGGGNRFVSLCGGRSEHLRRPGHLRVGEGRLLLAGAKALGLEQQGSRWSWRVRVVGGEGGGVRGETAGYAGPLGKDLDVYSEEMRSLSRAVVASDRFYQFPSGCCAGARW